MSREEWLPKTPSNNDNNLSGAWGRILPSTCGHEAAEREPRTDKTAYVGSLFHIPALSLPPDFPSWVASLAGPRIYMVAGTTHLAITNGKECSPFSILSWKLSDYLRVLS